MYFAVFRANFCVFLTIFLFYWLKWVLKKPLLHEKIYDNRLQQLVAVLWVRIIFFLKFDKKNGENWNYFSEFFAVFRFFSVFS